MSRATRSPGLKPLRLLPLALALAPCVALADEAPVPSTQPAALTGEWLGVRPRLAAGGLTLTGTYITETLGNVSGGLRRGASFNGLAELGGDLDLEKLAGWSGAAIHGMAYYPHGDSPSQKYVGDYAIVSNIDAGDSLRLYEAWFEQTLLDGRFALRIGYLAADSEFCVLDAATPFINSAFGVATPVSTDFPMPSYPFSGLGVRLKWKPAPVWTVLLAAYDGNPAPGVLPDPTPGAAPSNEDNRHGTQFALRHDEGAMLFAEAAWRRAQEEDKTRDAPLAAAVKVGGTYHTDRFGNIRDKTLGDLDGRRAAAAGSVDGDYAVYASAEQEVWREPKTKHDGLTAFARGCSAPPGRNFFSHSVEAGLVYHGLFQEEAGDTLCLGCAWLGTSREVRSAYRAAGQEAPRDEVILELTYQYAATAWWILQPDAQWVCNPGGADRHALVIGLRSTVTF